jgi:hypothetical protein
VNAGLAPSAVGSRSALAYLDHLDDFAERERDLTAAGVAEALSDGQ